MKYIASNGREDVPCWSPSRKGVCPQGDYIWLAVPPGVASAAERYLLQDHILWDSHMPWWLKHMYKSLAIWAQTRTIVTGHLAPELPVEMAEAANFALCPHLFSFPIFTEAGLMSWLLPSKHLEHEMLSQRTQPAALLAKKIFLKYQIF